MAAKFTPELEQWYLDTSRHCKFHVVEVNKEFVELEYVDGELEQLNISEWESLPLKKVSEPVEWNELDDKDIDLDTSIYDDNNWETDFSDIADIYHHEDD